MNERITVPNESYIILVICPPVGYNEFAMPTYYRPSDRRNDTAGCLDCV